MKLLKYFEIFPKFFAQFFQENAQVDKILWFNENNATNQLINHGKLASICKN
jgi:hypothetical protein